jgi:hypothetical protein
LEQEEKENEAKLEDKGISVTVDKKGKNTITVNVSK